MSRRRVIRRLAQDVAAERLTTAEAVILSYRHDHPGATAADAAVALGIPLACATRLVEAES